MFVSGDTLTRGCCMVTIKGEVVCEGTQPTFLSGLAIIFALYKNMFKNKAASNQLLNQV